MPCDPQAASATALAGSTVAANNIFRGGLMRGGIYRSEAVGGARGAQREEHDDQRRQRHHAHLAAHDRGDDRVLLALWERTDRARVSELALVEDRLSRGDA